MLPWRYIVVEGVIGVGKTSLSKLLATRTNGRLNLEVVEENPFLSQFYLDRSAYAFQTQIFFLLSRYRQQQSLFQNELFSNTLISDYLFAKDRIFANLNLGDDELELYNQLAAILEQRVRRPDLVIYLQARTEVLLQRINWRGRAFEQDMDAGYLDALNGAYSYFFHHYKAAPLLVVNTDHLDFVNVPRDFDLLFDQIREPFTGTRYFAPDTSGGI
ncbi:deoxynucleoside kinase [bacterium DOLJORAL78_65_58]|nr:MAG: deoxynucleoside kinase [bacterium DOLZORAL124_64_63]PIE75723.1 MAG: deoxynucleoside kinase [bacterium DOLJORAL78_65_58]